VARFVELEGGRQASYEIVGTGDPLLLFMGGPGLPAEPMRADADLFSDRFCSYLIDAHGSGGSSPPADPSAYDHLGHARFYDEVRRALGLDRVSVGGVSFGGTVALTYAGLFPEQTAGCIAVSAFALGTEVDETEGGDAAAEMETLLQRHAGAEWFSEARAVWDSFTDRVLAAKDAAEVDEMLRILLPLYCAHPDRPDVAEALATFRSQVRCDLAAVKAWEGGLYQAIDLRPALADIACPTVVITGELDLICGPAQARRIAEAIPGADLVVVPGCGHFPAIEAPDVYRRAVLDWVGARAPAVASTDA
jgi:proline iminopeptidase